MKKVKYPKLSDYDLSAYEELKGDILYRINGGAEIENSNDAVANAKVGDTLTRSNGEVVEITEEHIQWARDHGGKVLEGMDDGTPNSGDDGGSCVEPTESEKPAPSVENGSNTKNSSNNAGILSSNNNLKIPTTSNASSIQVASGANSAGRTNVNAGSNAAGTGSQAAVNSSRPSGVPGGVKGNTVTGKPIAGCVIEHTDDNQNIIRVSANDKNAMKEAEDKFLTYTNEGLDCKLEVYTANGSARVFNKYSDYVKDKTDSQTPVDYSIGFISNSETFNQNKTEKELFLEYKQDFTSPDASTTHVQAGLIHTSSELKNSPNHIAGGINFDLMEAEYDMMVRKENFGLKLSAGANVASLSGEIGAQGDDWKFSIAGSVGIGASAGFEFDWPEKRIALDASLFLGCTVVLDFPNF